MKNKLLTFFIVAIIILTSQNFLYAMFCVKCGVKNQDDSNFCNKCGYNFKSINSNGDENKQKLIMMQNLKNALIELMENEKKGIWEDAINSVDKLIALNINNNTLNSYFWTAKGMYLLNLKIFDTSLQSLDKAIELKPTNALAWYYKGCNYSYINNATGLKYEALHNAKKLGIDDRNVDNWINTYTGQEIQKAFKEIDNEYTIIMNQTNQQNYNSQNYINKLNCSECSAENDYNSKFCEKCGYIFGSRDNGKALFDKSINNPTKHNKCNKLINANEQFCDKCQINKAGDDNKKTIHQIYYAPKTEKGKELLQKLQKKNN